MNERVKTKRSRGDGDLLEAPGSSDLKKQRRAFNKSNNPPVSFSEFQKPISIEGNEYIPRPIQMQPPMLTPSDKAIQHIKALNVATLSELRAKNKRQPKQLHSSFRYQRPGILRDQLPDYSSPEWLTSNDITLDSFTNVYDVEWKETTVASLQISIDDILQDTDHNKTFENEDGSFLIPSEVALCYDIEVDFKLNASNRDKPGYVPFLMLEKSEIKVDDEGEWVFYPNTEDFGILANPPPWSADRVFDKDSQKEVIDMNKVTDVTKYTENYPITIQSTWTHYGMTTPIDMTAYLSYLENGNEDGNGIIEIITDKWDKMEYQGSTSLYEERVSIEPDNWLKSPGSHSDIFG